MKQYALADEKDRVVILSEDINSLTYSEFEDMINTLLENDVRNIIVSFQEVRYITSSAIGLLLDTKKVLLARGGNILVTDLNEYVHWVLRACGADSIIKISDKLSNAISLLDIGK